MADDDRKLPLNYASPVERPLGNGWWVGFLVAMGVIFGGGWLIFIATGAASAPFDFLAEHRVEDAVAGAMLVITSIAFMRVVVKKAQKQQVKVDAATADMGAAEGLMFCKRCGPFARGTQVVHKPSARATWTMRVTGAALVVGGGWWAWMCMRRDSLGWLYSFAAIALLVGINMIRFSADTSEKCPTCGGGIYDGQTAVGKRAIQLWQLKRK